MMDPRSIAHSLRLDGKNKEVWVGARMDGDDLVLGILNIRRGNAQYLEQRFPDGVRGSQVRGTARGCMNLMLLLSTLEHERRARTMNIKAPFELDIGLKDGSGSPVRDGERDGRRDNAATRAAPRHHGKS